ncbi:hypothetical protein M8C21_020924, partial [Ambrosia artemisiifolia]
RMRVPRIQFSRQGRDKRQGRMRAGVDASSNKCEVQSSQITLLQLVLYSIHMPLDLCDAISPSESLAPVGYQGPHAGGLPGPNNGTQASICSGSSPAYSPPGSSAMGLGNHLASASTPLSPTLR